MAEYVVIFDTATGNTVAKPVQGKHLADIMSGAKTWRGPQTFQEGVILSGVLSGEQGFHFQGDGYLAGRLDALAGLTTSGILSGGQFHFVGSAHIRNTLTTSGNILPSASGLHAVGTSSLPFYEMVATQVLGGDYIYAHGWRMTEADPSSGIMVVAPDGKKFLMGLTPLS